jgi:hypothetical protein
MKRRAGAVSQRVDADPAVSRHLTTLPVKLCGVLMPRSHKRGERMGLPGTLRSILYTN